MNFLEKYNLNYKKIAAFFGLFILFVIAIMFVSFLNQTVTGITSSRDSLSLNKSYGSGAYESSPMYDMASGIDYDDGMMIEESYTPGNTAEDYEVTEYDTRIETRNLDEDCDKFIYQKDRDDVIFESSSKGENNCSFRFKVEKDSADEIVGLINSLDPKDLNKNIYTIQKQIENYISEEDILLKKLTVIDETLSQAENSYRELAELATDARDASSLASIIEGKIRIIERLSQEKISISSRLDRIAKSKAEAMDRLEYVNFSVYIYENKYIDTDSLKDSWKSYIRSTISDFNEIVQNGSIGLMKFVALVISYMLYFVLLLFVAKLAWLIVKKVWQK